MMYIGNDLIEAVPLQKEGLRTPGYLGKFKRNLKMKYSELISHSPQPPDFLVVEPNPIIPKVNIESLSLQSPR
jgi:hypothetical protein